VRSKVVGEGLLPWAQILARLVSLGYDGALSLEYEYRWHPQDLPEPAIGFAASAAEVRRLWALAQGLS
jgi:sugar phosphate isomerase/epimerase